MKPSKVLALVLTAIMLMNFLAGCTILDDEKVLSNGSIENSLDVILGIKSNKTEFDVNDVTLNFYYGFRVHRPSDDKFYSIFIFNIKESINMSSLILYKDYRDFEGYFFMKEITTENFKEEYLFTSDSILFIPRRKINHHEKMTVPKEVFDGKKGTFVFEITDFTYYEEEKGYRYQCRSRCFVDYEYIDENTVRLSRNNDMH